MKIHCDAWGHGFGAILVQRPTNKERVIAYASRLLSSAESNYSTTEQECLALVWATQKFRGYLWRAKVKVMTDHQSLCWLMKKRELAGRLSRWSLQLQDWDIEIVHRSGRLHSDADVLSRHPVGPPENETDSGVLFFTCVSPIPDQGLVDSQRRSTWWQGIIAGLEEKHQNPRVLKLCQNYEMRDGILYHRIIAKGRGFHRLCLPPVYVSKALAACHNDASAGHLGTTRTIDKVTKQFFWPRMQKKIIDYDNI